MRTFYDAVTPANIPDSADGVAGYIDGLYKWPQAAWDRFAKKPQVHIAVFASTADNIAVTGSLPLAGPSSSAFPSSRQ